jgi:hypothetical protein
MFSEIVLSIRDVGSDGLMRIALPFKPLVVVMLPIGVRATLSLLSIRFTNPVSSLSHQFCNEFKMLCASALAGLLVVTEIVGVTVGVAVNDLVAVGVGVTVLVDVGV